MDIVGYVRVALALREVTYLQTPQHPLVAQKRLVINLFIAALITSNGDIHRQFFTARW